MPGLFTEHYKSTLSTVKLHNVGVWWRISIFDGKFCCVAVNVSVWWRWSMLVFDDKYDCGEV